MWNINKLKNWDKNPRSINKDDFEKLKWQIQKLGQYKPLIITQDGVVLGGNMRLKAYKALNVENVWVSIVEADSDEKKLEYALSDNDRAGYYDEQALFELVNELPDLSLENFGVDLIEASNLSDLFKESTEEKDFMNYQEKYQIAIDCKDENEQKEVYEKLTKQGYPCKILTL